MTAPGQAHNDTRGQRDPVPPTQCLSGAFYRAMDSCGEPLSRDVLLSSLSQRRPVRLSNAPVSLCTQITGMDGTPKMFAYPAKDNVPDVNSYLYETGIIEVLLPSDPDALFSNNAHESLKETHAPLRRTSDTIIVIVALFFQAAECTAYVPDDDE